MLAEYLNARRCYGGSASIKTDELVWLDERRQWIQSTAFSYRKTSDRSRVPIPITSRAPDTGRGSESIVLIEAGSRLQAGSRKEALPDSLFDIGKQIILRKLYKSKAEVEWNHYMVGPMRLFCNIFAYCLLGRLWNCATNTHFSKWII
jgi:hypothetical protein